MSPIAPQTITRFARLPRLPGEVWQGGLFRMPTWVEDGPEGKPYRPWGAVWVSSLSGRVTQRLEPEPGAHGSALALEALLEFGLEKELVGCRPVRLEVPDAELAAYLRQALGEASLAVSVVRDQPAVKLLLADFAEHMHGGPVPPDALDAPGLTLERLRAFAAAAETFYRAAPWRFLSDEDLIQVEAPAIAPGLRHLTVLGGAGFVSGIGFYETPEAFESLLEGSDPEEVFAEAARWSVLFGTLSEMPFGDADVWEDQRLPAADPRAYPVAMRTAPDGTISRPDAKTLADLEGLLRALGDTREEAVDRGRWGREVRTQDGPKAFTLSLPALLEPLEAAPSTAATALEQAQELARQAFDTRGRRRVQLARKALEISTDCADAYGVLAEQAAEPEAALDLYVQALAAGERALGTAAFAEEAEPFWGSIRTRPYMRARLGLAHCLADLGRADEAVDHYQALLHLNPHDDQGVRHTLLPVLLEAGRDAEAGTLLAQYRDEVGAVWQYGWALWAFRQEGDSPAAKARLRQAFRANPRVSKYLTGKLELPELLPDAYAPGSEDEAVLCADALESVWRSTPDAERWLRTSQPTPKPKQKPHPRRRR
jgi:tetratricopeptide (TPR) repeat protein